MSQYNHTNEATAPWNHRESERKRREELAEKADTLARDVGIAPAPYSGVPGLVGGVAPGRQSARDVLWERIYRLRNKVASLEALANILPAVLPPDADAALWELLIDAR